MKSKTPLDLWSIPFRIGAIPVLMAALLGIAIAVPFVCLFGELSYNEPKKKRKKKKRTKRTRK